MRTKVKTGNRMRDDSRGAGACSPQNQPSSITKGQVRFDCAATSREQGCYRAQDENSGNCHGGTYAALDSLQICW
jgi:hypothetical protein